MSKQMKVYASILTIAALGQITLAFLLYKPEGNQLLINIGWGVLLLSAVFGWLPLYAFRKKGEVRGKGYIHTT
jgi:hypothetical protein